jgi:hypothetical protein
MEGHWPDHPMVGLLPAFDRHQWPNVGRVDQESESEQEAPER